MARHSLVHQLMDWAARKPNTGAIYGKQPDGGLHERTWKEYLTEVREAAKGLIALGLQPGQCVAIVGKNSPEWVICQFGIMAAGGIPAPIYTTNTGNQVAYIVGHCRCEIGICDDETQLAKYQACAGGDGISMKTIVTMENIDGGEYTLESLRALGCEQDDAELDARLEATDPTKTCLLIYTSGTTGVPKAVELTNEGLILVGTGINDGFPQLGEYRSISYLPLCHVAEQIFTNVLMLELGGEVYFCPDLKQVKDYLTDVRPTVFLGVPRVWEKFEAALRAKLGEAIGIKASLASWAMKTELAAFKEGARTGRPVDSFFRRLANKLVISKVKDKLGLDKIIAAATGAAPINVTTQEFFASLGICIYEGYGMSETSGVATVNDTSRPVFGSVGRPLPGVELKLAEDGEILLKGKNMTKSYLYMPDMTEELFDEAGWLRTGDLGEISDDGNLRITGRKKDLIITAGGKNVAPAEVEAYLKTIPGVGEAVVIGDRQRFLSALITLDVEALPELCAELGIANDSLANAAESPKMREHIQQHVETDCNSKLARYQTIKKFEIMPVEFTVDGGELTPTMKVKRNIVNEKYKDYIDAMYATPAPAQSQPRA